MDPPIKVKRPGNNAKSRAARGGSVVATLSDATFTQGDFTLERIAWRCGLGERTLRRRLEEAGTSFRALVDEVRKERALALLEHEGNVALVAQSLGFSDSTAFARAFRRWTLSLPHEHLRRSQPAEG